MTPINFKASFIQQAPIKRLENNRYTPTTASFIELHPKDKNDLSALEDVSKKWWNAEYADIIYNNAFCDSILENGQFNRHYYAITTQQDSFEKPDPEQILGITEFTESPDKNEISFLQTNPKNISYPRVVDIVEVLKNTFNKILGRTIEEKPIERPEYTGAGKGIVNSIKEVHPDKDIELHSVDSAKKFYEKLGFKTVSFLYPNNLVWRCDDKL